MNGTEQTERQLLYRLVEDVATLKADSQNGNRSREIARQQVDRLGTTVGDIDRKLDRVLGAEARLRDAEAGVADYRKTKSRLLSLVTGFGLGAGGVGGAVSSALARWLNGA